MWIVVLAPPVALVGLTAIGARRRGAGIALSTLQGVCFPLTWVAWYVKDERPYRTA